MSADVSRNTPHHPCAQAEAVEQCMFRILDVVDPEQPDAGPILQLEHEVRSATKADGTKYKSCPLDVV